MKQVAVAPNSLLTGSPETVFRNKTNGDVKTVNQKIWEKYFLHVWIIFLIFAHQMSSKFLSVFLIWESEKMSHFLRKPESGQEKKNLIDRLGCTIFGAENNIFDSECTVVCSWRSESQSIVKSIQWRPSTWRSEPSSQLPFGHFKNSGVF